MHRPNKKSLNNKKHLLVSRNTQAAILKKFQIHVPKIQKIRGSNHPISFTDRGNDICISKNTHFIEEN